MGLNTMYGGFEKESMLVIQGIKRMVVLNRYSIVKFLKISR